MTQNELIWEKSRLICLAAIVCQREQFWSQCCAVSIVLEELLDLVHLGQKRIQDHFVERPPRFWRPRDLFESQILIFLPQPPFVEYSFHFWCEPVSKAKNRIDVRDLLEIFDDKIESMGKTPYMLERGRDCPKFMLNKPFQLGSHPVEFSRHAVCAVGCNRDKFRKRDVVSFQATKNKLCEFFASWSITYWNENGKLFHAVVEGEHRRSDENVVLPKEWSVQINREILASVKTFLNSHICRTHTSLTLPYARKIAGVYSPGNKTVSRVNENKNAFYKPIQNVGLWFG